MTIRADETANSRQFQARTQARAYKGAAASAWIIYTVIVFEIIFMVSPFALYYYSIYAVPLNLLQGSPATSWLALHILPHFSYTNSLFSNLLILFSWPLIFTGLIIFLLGFAQIYWAKFTGKGAVAVGLYKHIRHPQYLGLAIAGLGTTIFWSRFIVLITYVTMLCLYYALARLEERLCMDKFGESYRTYVSRTRMFFPAPLIAWLPAWELRLPGGSGRRATFIAFGYFLILATTVSGGWLLKSHVLDQVQVVARGPLTLVALAPFEGSTLGQVGELLVDDEAFQANLDAMELDRVIAYVAPDSWSVPELGLMSSGGYGHSGGQELLHPTIHGNSLDFAEDRVNVLIAEPTLADVSAKGRDLLARTPGYVPRMLVRINLVEGRILRISDSPAESYWKGIPVPVY